ncbi:hypothetical protein [Pleionea sediminis]|uniref:hypothetical protein n=1 Tax=Pleionea sediminis TaxID=2569479 RepID=UPI00118674FD|nr:hypothetical protein [Pleionea sediminis]
MTKQSIMLLTLLLTTVLGLITGCQTQRSDAAYKTVDGQWQTPLPINLEKSLFPNIDTVLTYRTHRCQLNNRSVKQEISKYQQESEPSSELEIFVLTSCYPESFSKLFKKQLNKLMHEKHWPDTYHSLATMLNAQLKIHNDSIQEKDKVINKLHKTIEALTKIEQEINLRER